MIRKTISLALLTTFSTLAFAQPKKQAPLAAPKPNPHLKVFNQALSSGDANTAIAALNYYISEQGDQTTYADTLAMLYMQQGGYGQCYYWADKRLNTQPDNNTLMELKGICLDKLNQPKEAIDVFEKLFKRTQSPYHAYKLMELQYGIKRLAECLATAEAAERLTYKPDYLMTYNIGQQTGRTYLQAGVYNIHALTLYDLDKKAEAKVYFEKALALDSSFVLAKQNLQAILALENSQQKVQPAAGNQSASPAKKEN